MPKIDLSPKLPVPPWDRVFAWVLTIVVLIGGPLASYNWPSPVWAPLIGGAAWMTGMFFCVAYDRRNDT